MHKISNVQFYLNNIAGREKIYRVPHATGIITDMPAPIAKALLELGMSLRLARERCGLSIRALAAETNVSAPIVISMERGEATVSMAVCAAALRFYGRAWNGYLT